MPQAFATRWTREGGEAIVAIIGEVDLGTASRVREAVKEARDSTGPVPLTTLILDLSEVEHLDSLGLAVLVETAAECHSADQALALICPTPVVTRPLEMTGLDGILTITASLAEAREAARRALAEADR
ncbi:MULTISPECIES: STAS domain-containing protein [Amycolatopsis]|uniref:Anti-sigma factor antagonist n=1 Tax=Amycolatopsis viridis TaxID=185678 RepID=A0ABX0SQG2_9PSEU|nr:STAS domain-containing protein [Amycolatopsis viridis]NIH79133.1 anti-sigma B factor antagonist [Amycolatopsis viridis]NIH87728.1 anti-sigma B factor antagonist [Amycolatopsis granulosa]